MTLDQLMLYFEENYPDTFLKLRMNYYHEDDKISSFFAEVFEDENFEKKIAFVIFTGKDSITVFQDNFAVALPEEEKSK